MLKAIIIVMLITPCITLFATAAKAQTTLNVLAIEHPPFTSSKMSHNGLAFILLRQYAKEHFKAAIKPRIMPIARVQVLLQYDRWCLSFYPPVLINELTSAITITTQNIKLGMYRKHRESVFSWQHLREFSGAKIALLRSAKSSRFYQMYLDAGLIPVLVESTEQGVQLLLKAQVDYAFSDNISMDYASLSQADRDSLQFSQTTLLETPIQVYYNQKCHKQLYGSQAQ